MATVLLGAEPASAFGVTPGAPLLELFNEEKDLILQNAIDYLYDDSENALQKFRTFIAGLNPVQREYLVRCSQDASRILKIVQPYRTLHLANPPSPLLVRIAGKLAWTGERGYVAVISWFADAEEAQGGHVEYEVYPLETGKFSRLRTRPSQVEVCS